MDTLGPVLADEDRRVPSGTMAIAAADLLGSPHRSMVDDSGGGTSFQ